MLKSSARAAIYADMVDLVSKRHIRGALQDAQGGVCLVGAANRAADAWGGRWASREIQQELRDELLARSPMLRLASLKLDMDDVAPDGGLSAIEAWNDVPWRRTRLAVQVLSDLAAKHAAEAREELIAELQAAVADLVAQQEVLRARVEELEAENTYLTEEVAYWKRAWYSRRARTSAEDLTSASEELAELDRQLNATLVKLTSEVVPTP